MAYLLRQSGQQRSFMSSSSSPPGTVTNALILVLRYRYGTPEMGMNSKPRTTECFHSTFSCLALEATTSTGSDCNYRIRSFCGGGLDSESEMGMYMGSDSQRW